MNQEIGISHGLVKIIYTFILTKCQHNCVSPRCFASKSQPKEKVSQKWEEEEQKNMLAIELSRFEIYPTDFESRKNMPSREKKSNRHPRRRGMRTKWEGWEPRDFLPLCSETIKKSMQENATSVATWAVSCWSAEIVISFILLLSFTFVSNNLPSKVSRFSFVIIILCPLLPWSLKNKWTTVCTKRETRKQSHDTNLVTDLANYRNLFKFIHYYFDCGRPSDYGHIYLQVSDKYSPVFHSTNVWHLSRQRCS